MGGLIPYVRGGRRKHYDGTTYEIDITFLRLGFKFEIMMPWGGFGSGGWRPW